MSWLGSLFGTKKAMSDITDKDNGLLTQVGGWIGGFSYTDQEKAEADQQTREWGLRQIEALAPFKIMQRIMVTIIMSVWAMLCIVMTIAICIKSPDIITNLLLFIQSPFVWVPVSGAVGLYLMGGVVPSRRP